MTATADGSTTIFASSGRGMEKFLGVVEKVGNKLPHLFYLFWIIAGIVAIASWIVSATGATTLDPSTGETVPVRSLISGEGLAYMLTNAIPNFVSFPPLGLIIVVMLGIGVAERSGLLKTAMRAAVLATPAWAITFVVVVVSLMGNIASDTAMVVIPPLAAMAYLAAGRHPLVGFGVSFGAVIIGFSANVIPAGTDVLLAGITTTAAQVVDPAAEVSPLANWYFMSVSTVIFAIVITITARFVEKRALPYTGDADVEREAITREEKRGLIATLIAVAVFIAVVVITVAVPGSPLRGEDGEFLQSPFMSSIPVILFLFFLTAGVTYGLVSKSVTHPNDVPKMMTEAVRELVPFLVVIFAAAQAIAWFNWSNMGFLVATSGAEFLTASGLDGVWGLLIFSLFVALPALVVGSGSALWTLLGPVFVPMFMLAGLDPAAVQAAFRVTDSATNPLVLMNPMLPVVIGLMQKFDPRAKLGTLISLMIPFFVVVWVVWLAQLMVWGIFDLPFGPGYSMYAD